MSLTQEIAEALNRYLIATFGISTYQVLSRRSAFCVPLLILCGVGAGPHTAPW